MQRFSLNSLAARLFTVSTATGTGVSPIVITTTAPHSYVNGDVVTLLGVGGNTNANGTWIARTISPTTVALYSAATGLASTGNANFTAGGTISAPTQLPFAANDPNVFSLVAKILFSPALANLNVALVGGAGLNQGTLAGVIRQLNKANVSGTSDGWMLESNQDNNVLDLRDYWVDFIAPLTDAVLVTYWRA